MYRNIETSIWTDEKFRTLPGPAKLLFLYLITNPHAHVSGCYYLPDPIVIHESGVKAENLDRVWDTLSELGVAYRDKKLEVVWVKNMFAYQGRGKKLIAAAAKQVETLHNSPLVNNFLSHYPAVKKVMKRKGINRVSGVGLQDQDQEKDQDSKRAAPSADEIGDDGKVISAETVYRAYPKHVEPEPSRKSISDAVRYLRKQGTPDPWAWLLGRVRMYADARAELERKFPGANKFIPACHRWMKRKRYEEDPAIWPTEEPGFAVSRNGTVREETPAEYARRVAASRAEAV